MRKSGLVAAVSCALLGVASMTVTSPAAPQGSRAPHVVQVAPKAAVVTNGAWPVYHHDDAHSGFDPTQPTAAGATTGWVSSTLDGAVYAEPLVWQGIVYVATLNNTVYALNQADGTTIWSKHVGAADTSNDWLCGNVSPQGILGTPVIDTAANRIYVAAFMSTHVYTVFGLDLANSGNIVLQTDLPTYLGAMDWKIQQERGALALRNGYVYVPLGGRDGDCNDGNTLYQGWIYGVPTSGTGTVNHWNSGFGGGQSVWAPGGIAVDDSTGRIFFATGQGNCPSSYDYNNAVIRLSPTLALEDYFAPFDWHTYACTDNDIGSASPVLISPTLAFEAGKPGQGYLVNPQSLGGIDGQLYPAKNTNVPVCLGNSGAANYGAYAYAAPYVYLECEGSGITGLKVDTVAKTFSACDSTCGAPSWNNGSGTYGSPIVAGGIVWAVSTDGFGLTGFDAVTGGVIFQSAAFSSRRFSTPTEAGGQIFVASNTVIREFKMVTACSGVTLAAVPASPQVAGTPETLTASGVTNCTSPLYRFWMRPPGGAWTVLQNYSAGNTFNWSSDTAIGTYGLEVDVKSSASTAAYDSVANISFTTTAANACTNAGLALSPPSPGPTGAAVTMTGSSSGCPNPRYRFWVKDPGSRWSMVQDYSASTTHVWSQTGLAGTYAMEVDVRDASESVAYDVVANANYVLNGCSAVTLTPTPASPQAHGTPITLTGSATCPGTPTYRFWVRNPGGSWHIVRDYSTTNTFTWTPGSAGTYSLEVDVRDQNATAAYEVVANTTFNAT